jgi:hypothetical protein
MELVKKISYNNLCLFMYREGYWYDSQIQPVRWFYSFRSQFFCKNVLCLDGFFFSS